jgi:hydrogenase expression/formation protein HypE
MELGKFPPQLLETLLENITTDDPRVLTGPRIGEDSSVIEMGEHCLVATSDPITLATEDIGWYAVHVNANDIACSGGTPKWFLPTLLVPESYSEESASAIFHQIHEACSDIGVTIIGGHSEVSSGIKTPIVAATMLGEVQKKDIIRTGGAIAGDSIVLTKGIAIEGTTALANDYETNLKDLGASEEIITRAKALLKDIGISVLRDAQVACSESKVNSMHDPTEGGLATALHELASASGLGIAVEEGSIPVLPECKSVSDLLGLDPLGLLASGALLITLHSSEVPKLLRALQSEGITGWEIGQVLDQEEGSIMIGNKGEVDLPVFSRDELARYISSLQR